MPSMNEVMNFVVENRASELGLEVVADLFDRLIWILNDNGASIENVRHEWLGGSDPIRVEIGLLMHETFPFHSREEMEREFLKISVDWPQFRTLCDQTLQRWDIQSHLT